MDDINELAKAMKVIRFKTKSGRYLTAGDDQVSVTLSKPEKVGYSLENTEWTLEWLEGPNKDLEGQVRLWSRYNKALHFPHDPADYVNVRDTWGDALTQQPWPRPSPGGEAASVWKFKLKEGKNYDVPQVGYLFKRSKRWRKDDYMFNYDTSETKFEFYGFYFKQWREQMTHWIVEVVQVKSHGNTSLTTCIDSQNKLTISQLQLAPSHQPQPQPRPQGCANKVTTCIRLPSPPKNEDKSHDESLRVGSNSKNNVGYSSPDQLMSMFSRCQVGQVVLYVSPLQRESIRVLVSILTLAVMLMGLVFRIMGMLPYIVKLIGFFAKDRWAKARRRQCLL